MNLQVRYILIIALLSAVIFGSLSLLKTLKVARDARELGMYGPGYGYNGDYIVRSPNGDMIGFMALPK